MEPNGADDWLTTTEAAIRYGISTDLLRMWRRWEGFPRAAVVRDGNKCFWNAPQIDQWLRDRPLHAMGRPPSWTKIVGHPMARELA